MLNAIPSTQINLLCKIINFAKSFHTRRAPIRGGINSSWNHPLGKPARILILICDPWDIFKSLCKVTHLLHFLLSVQTPKLLHGYGCIWYWVFILKFRMRRLFKKWKDHNTSQFWSPPDMYCGCILSKFRSLVLNCR